MAGPALIPHDDEGRVEIQFDDKRLDGGEALVNVRDALDRRPVGTALMPGVFEVVFPLDGEGDRPLASAIFEVVGGGIRCVSATVRTWPGGPVVTPADLRSVRITDMQDHAERLLARPADAPAYSLAKRDAVSRRDLDAARATVTRSRRRINDDLLREVASVYEANIDSHPGKAVERHFDVKERTAQNWITRAAREGFITRRARPDLASEKGNERG